MGVYLFRRVHDWARSEVREEADEFLFFSSSGSQDRTRVVERLRPLSHLVGLGSQRVPLAFRHWSHFTFIACHFICAPRE